MTHLGHRTTGSLFETVHHTPYSPRAFSRSSRRRQPTRTSPSGSPHTCSATRWRPPCWNGACPSSRSRNFFEHAKLETAQIYAESSAEMIKESYQKALAG